MNAINWIDDPTDYPLAYAFKYSLNAEDEDFSLAPSSEKAYTASPLPAGLDAQNNNVACKAVIADALGAFVLIQVTVVVAAGSKSALSGTLNSELGKAFESGNTGNAIGVTD